MPYAPLQRPSIALGILKSLLAEAGFECSVHYPNLRFAELLGVETYELLALAPCEEALFEFIFAPLAFPDADRDDAQFLERFLVRNQGFPIRNVMRLAELCGRARKAARTLLLEVERQVAGAQIVGCTSMFQQHVASLALLRQLKERDDRITTIMGGPNCEAGMGVATHRNYPWIDYIVSGEAENLIVPLIRRILEGPERLIGEALPLGVFGPMHRVEGYPLGPTGDAPRAAVNDIASVPLPDHHDYFSALGEVNFRAQVIPALSFETARGCWWGAIKHCTFCGLNGASMKFRSKPGEQVCAEISALAEEYGVTSMSAVDNIVDLKYFESVFPKLAQSESRVSLFYESKSNLKRAHLKVARSANVLVLQPGIESLNSHALAHMEKGVQAWQNIQFLRFAREQGIRTIWTNLVGFPGEDDDWHRQAAEIFPLLSHLEPGGTTRVRYDRFSPIFRSAERAGTKLMPTEGYQHIYPVRGADLFDQSYFFEPAPVELTDGGDWVASAPYWSRGATALLEASRSWRAEWQQQKPLLAMTDEGAWLVVEDTRLVATQSRHRLGAIERITLLKADDAPPVHRLVAEVSAETGVSHEEVGTVIQKLEMNKLVLLIDDRAVALPTLGRPRPLVSARQHPLGTILPQSEVNARPSPNPDSAYA